VRIQMTIDKKKPEPVPSELTSIRYRIEANERVLRDRVIRTVLRPKPKWMPERLYQYLLAKLFTVRVEDSK
jgi:hypothetical protein